LELPLESVTTAHCFLSFGTWAGAWTDDVDEDGDEDGDDEGKDK